MADTVLLLNAVKATQELRKSVARVFDNLSTGIHEAEHEEGGSGNNYLSELQQGLDIINRDME